MTRRTTAEWEALLDGTTDGPWCAEDELYDDPDEPVLVIQGDEPHANPYTLIANVSIQSDEEEDAEKRANAELIAAAPAAVAELVYMHGALGSLVTWCETKAEKARNYSRPGAQEQMKRTAIVYEELARRVTEILEIDLYEEDE